MSDQIKKLFATALTDEANFEFESARQSYSEIAAHALDSPEAKISQERLAAVDTLIKEKQIYQRIDENAKRVLTDIGVNIASTPRLMDILMEADAVDFESETAVAIPLKRDYIEACLEKVPKKDQGVGNTGT